MTVENGGGLKGIVGGKKYAGILYRRDLLGMSRP